MLKSRTKRIEFDSISAFGRVESLKATSENHAHMSVALLVGQYISRKRPVAPSQAGTEKARKIEETFRVSA